MRTLGEIPVKGYVLRGLNAYNTYSTIYIVYTIVIRTEHTVQYNNNNSNDDDQ